MRVTDGGPGDWEGERGQDRDSRRRGPEDLTGGVGDNIYSDSRGDDDREGGVRHD